MLRKRLTGNVTQDREEDVDEEVSAAAALEEDTNGREEDGEDDFDDVAAKTLSVFRCAQRREMGNAYEPVKGMVASVLR